MSLKIRRCAVDGAWTELTAEGDVTVGRGSGNQIQLPGLLVAINHLRLTPLGPLLLRLECLSVAGVVVNDVPGLRSADLVAGDVVQVGGHQLFVKLDDDKASLMLEIVEGDTRRLADGAGAITSLADAGWRMRRPALIAAVTILALLLLLPLVLRAFSLPTWVGDWIPSDRLWSSGPVSNAHLSFGSQCSTCHTQLFNQVKDQACLACHATVSAHGSHPAAMKQSGLDQASCASCHLEHGGPHAIKPRHPAQCTQCHANPEKENGLAGVGAVTDFAKQHPQFRVMVGISDQSGIKHVRQTLSAESKDQSGLIFPHDLHLNSKGIRGANGSEVLGCASCHERSDDSAHFTPVRFEQHCKACHQLDADIGDKRLRLPHGDEPVVRALLASAAGLPAAGTSLDAPAEGRLRPNRSADDAMTAEPPINPIDDVIERAVCAKCHQVNRAPDGAVSVLPVQLPSTWMPHARFTHAPHSAVNCQTCHAAGQSTSSDDLLLTGISSCRECHGGVGSSSSKISTTCIDCHEFHGTGTGPMKAPSGR